MNVIIRRTIPLVAILMLSTTAAFAFYNPTGGRWLSRDSIEERGGVALFAFVGNTPTGTVDRDGTSFGNPVPGRVEFPDPTLNPASLVRTLMKSVATKVFGVYQVVLDFDLKVSDGDGKPVAGAAVSEFVDYLSRNCLIGGAPATGSTATDPVGVFRDIQSANFCCAAGTVSVIQKIKVGTKSAIVFTTINANGTWNGTLRAVFQ